ncbi:MAG: peptidase MA family metallohydrolase [candidate division Zixibacteria bacterium]|nr:peptidase MA family metallohydrolase [candidate division Zixibacteria bacterium]
MKVAFRFFLCLILLIAIRSYAQDSTSVIEREHFIYRFNSPLFAEIANSALTEAREKLIKILGDTISYKPVIIIADDINQFKEAVGGAFPDWGAAAALPYRQLIVIKSPAHFRLGRSMKELLQHEYSHLALADRLRFVRVPRWVDEGLAMYVSSEWGWGENLTMTRSAIFNALIPLENIELLNQFSEGKAMTAYAQSYLAVKYLLDNYGSESFNIFLNTLRVRKTADQALMAATGSGYDGFEKEFFAYLKQRYNLMTFFADTIYLWIFLALVVMVSSFLYFRRRKKYYRQWEDEERFQSRDFDYGDPDNPEEASNEDKPRS